MNDDRKLRQLAQQLVRAGTLPARRPDRIWGGAAFGGSQCLLCGNPVEHGGIALEVEFKGGDDGDGKSAHLHIRCFQALDGVLSGLDSAQCAALDGEDGRPTAMPGATAKSRNGSNLGVELPRAVAGTTISTLGRRSKGCEERDGGAA